LGQKFKTFNSQNGKILSNRLQEYMKYGPNKNLKIIVQLSEKTGFANPDRLTVQNYLTPLTIKKQVEQLYFGQIKGKSQIRYNKCFLKNLKEEQIFYCCCTCNSNGKEI
jgi:hypothetical protein